MLKKYSRALALKLVPFLGSLIIRFLYITNKKIFHAPKTISDDAFILGSWHNDLLMLPYIYFYYRKPPRVKAIISNHFDGALIASTMKHFKIGNLAGSSTRNAARVLIQAIKTIKEGTDIAITPDGPKGPRHEVADGIVVIAQKTKAKVVLVSIKPTKYWELNSWDKFIIPKPFGTIHFYASEAVDISMMEMQEAKEFIKNGLSKYEK